MNLHYTRLLDELSETRGMEAVRVRLDRFAFPTCNETHWLTTGEELLYIFLDARGAMSVEGSGAQWQYHVGTPTAVWVPAGLNHGFRNTGDAPARGVVVSASRQDRLSEDAGEIDSSPAIVPLADLPRRCMVSFLTRTVLSHDAAPGLLRLSEIQTILPGGSVPEHAHAARNEVCYVLCGAGLLLLNDDKQEITAGQGTFIPPGGRHCIINRTDQVLEYVIAQFGDRGMIAELEARGEGS